MLQPFKNIPILGKCKTQVKNTGHSTIYGEYATMEYIKIDHRKAKCINQTGYGNTRAVNGIYVLFGKMVTEINNQ